MFQEKPSSSSSILQQNLSSLAEEEEFATRALLYMDKRCILCLTQETPLWRFGFFCPYLKQMLPLCNACFFKFKKSKHCEICLERIDIKNERTSISWMAKNQNTQTLVDYPFLLKSDFDSQQKHLQQNLKLCYVHTACKFFLSSSSTQKSG